MFAGIAKLDFDDDLEVLRMKSADNEIIPLVNQISTVKARGQVDKWLAELEIQMRLSLQQQIDNAMERYENMPITESAAEFPSQVKDYFISWIPDLSFVGIIELKTFDVVVFMFFEKYEILDFLFTF